MQAYLPTTQANTAKPSDHLQYRILKLVQEVPHFFSSSDFWLLHSPKARKTLMLTGPKCLRWQFSHSTSIQIKKIHFITSSPPYVLKSNIQFQESPHPDQEKFFPFVVLFLRLPHDDILALSPWVAKWKEQVGTNNKPELFGGRRRMRGYGRRVRRATDARSPVAARTDRRFWLGRRSWPGDAMSAKGLLCTDGNETFI